MLDGNACRSILPVRGAGFSGRVITRKRSFNGSFKPDAVRLLLRRAPEKVWEGFVSPESNRIIFGGADLEADLRPGGAMNWVGRGADGKRTTYVHGEVLQSERPRLLQYTFALASSSQISRASIELTPETEATKVSVVHDEWVEDDRGYASCAAHSLAFEDAA